MIRDYENKTLSIEAILFNDGTVLHNCKARIINTFIVIENETDTDQETEKTNKSNWYNVLLIRRLQGVKIIEEI